MPRKSGPPRKPTSLRVLEGNPSKRPLPKGEPKPASAVPAPPLWLDDHARAEWGRIVPELNALGLLSCLDMSSLVGYVTTWSEFVQAEREIAEYRDANGGRITFTTPNGALQQIPAVGVRNKAARLLLAFAAEFGLSPSARAAIDMSKLGQPKEDEIEGLLSGC